MRYYTSLTLRSCLPAWCAVKYGLTTILALVLYGCGGGGGGGPAPAPVPAEVTISGTAQYEFINASASTNGGLDYSAIDARPIRGATVEARRGSDSTLIVSTVSDGGGNFSLAVPSQTDVFIRVRSELKSTGTPAWDAEVRDNTSNTAQALNSRPVYALDGPSGTSGAANSTRNLVAESGWTGSAYTAPRAAAPFSILDVIYNGIQLVLSVDPNATFAPLDAFWSVNNCPVTGAIENGEITTSFYDDNIDSLFLLGCADVDTEEFDTTVVAHEWGHYFEDAFSRSDSIGGVHAEGQRLDMRLAFGEGFGYAIAAMVEGRSRIVDSFNAGQGQSFEFDVENNAGTNPGWFSEASVQSILYDLFDATNDAVDTVSLGFSPLYDVLVGAQRTSVSFTSIFTFATALKEQNPAFASEIDALLAGQSINGTGIDIIGSTETNNAGNNDVLPIFAPLAVDQGAVSVCTTNAFDPPFMGSRDGNKLGISRYLNFTIAASGTFTIQVTKAASPDVSADTDPDFLIHSSGTIVQTGLSTVVNQETLTSSLAAGDYVLEVAECEYAFPQSTLCASTALSTDRVCYDVTLATG